MGGTLRQERRWVAGEKSRGIQISMATDGEAVGRRREKNDPETVKTGGAGGLV